MQGITPCGGLALNAAAVLFVMLSVVLPGRAAEFAKRSTTPTGFVSLTPTLGGYLFSGSEHLRSQPQYGLKIGYDIVGSSIVDSLGIEASYALVPTTSTRDSAAVQAHLFRVDATYPFIQRGRVIPFVAIGAGGLDMVGGGRSEVDPLLNYGAGVKYFFEDYLAFRADVRHLLVYNHTHTRNNAEIVIGLTYVFGKEHKKTVAKSAPPPSGRMKGPDLAKPAAPISEVPVPLAGALPVPMPIVLDRIRLLGSSLGGASLVLPPLLPEKGTSVADGPVPTVNTGKEPVAEAAVVEPDKPRILSTATIEFAAGSSEMSTEQYQDLIDLAETLKLFPYSTVAIASHADDNGGRSETREIAARRSTMFAQKLQLMGIPPGRIGVDDRESTAKGCRRGCVILTIDFHEKQTVPDAPE